MKKAIAISINNLTKCYKVNKETFFALKDINFEIQKGEVLGIIGENGAGKSSLLKILAEVVPPSEGTIEVNGKILSILEVGSGFHYDLSGKENVYFNAAIHGLSKKQIDEIYNDIVEFSGIKDFIHEPVKTYSDGMYLRLALSILLHIDFDVILLDEVINVGDAEFRQKSMNYILKLIKSGKTCILISHDINAIANICDRCVILKNGEISFVGSSKIAIGKYLKGVSDLFDNKSQMPILSEHCDLLDVCTNKKQYEINEPIHLSIIFSNKKDLPIYVLFVLKNNFSKLISDSELFRQQNAINKKGIYTASCILPYKLLNTGNYYLDVFLTDSSKCLIQHENAISFEISSPTEAAVLSWHKITELVSIQIDCNWRITQQ